MSNELSATFNGSATIYVQSRRIRDGRVRNHTTGAWVVWADGDIADYKLALSFLGGDLYAADAHAGLVVGQQYQFFYFRQAGGAPSIRDSLLTSKGGTWNGATIEPTPAPAEEEDAVDPILELALAPERVTDDEGTVKERKIQEAIDAERYLAAKEADDMPFGLKMARMKFPGTQG